MAIDETINNKEKFGRNPSPGIDAQSKFEYPVLPLGRHDNHAHSTYSKEHKIKIETWLKMRQEKLRFAKFIALKKRIQSEDKRQI